MQIVFWSLANYCQTEIAKPQHCSAKTVTDKTSSETLASLIFIDASVLMIDEIRNYTIKSKCSGSYLKKIQSSFHSDER